MLKALVTLALLAAVFAFDPELIKGKLPKTHHGGLFSMNNLAVSPMNVTRLPMTFMPHRYRIMVKTYMPSMMMSMMPEKMMTTETETMIDVECMMETNMLTLHMTMQTLKDAMVMDAMGMEVKVTHHEYNMDKHHLILHLERSIAMGEMLMVKLMTMGKIQKADKPNGLYASTYMMDGKMMTMLVTHFETTTDMSMGFFRSLVPCFDEPMFKASFQMTYMYPKEYMALNNMPMVYQMDMGNGWMKTVFGATPKMSSYLNAMIIGDLEMMETVNMDGTAVRLWGWKGTKSMLKTSLMVAAKSTDYYSKHYMQSYSMVMPKMDLVGVPQFGPGAMENWGLLIFRDSALFIDDMSYTQKEMLRPIDVTLHEVAHQWFGDLVTTEWFSQIWLNEGFATYEEYPGGMHVFPEDMRLWMLKNSEIVMGGMRADEAYNKPIISDMQPFFTGLDYSKAASLIRMLMFVMGPMAFREGLQMYLMKHKFSNTMQDDLWMCLQMAATKHSIMGPDMKPLDVMMFMKPYFMQAKYPIVDVKMMPNNMMSLQQRPMQTMMQNPKLPPSMYKYMWPIPLRMWNAEKMQMMNMMMGGKMNMNDMAMMNMDMMKMMMPDMWLMPGMMPMMMPVTNMTAFCNPLGGSYFRTNYDDASFKMLMDMLMMMDGKSMMLDGMTHSLLLDDAEYFMRMEKMSGSRFMDLTMPLMHQMDYVAWETAMAKMLNKLDMRLKMSVYYKLYQRYVSKLVMPMYNMMGWKSMDDMHMMMNNGMPMEKMNGMILQEMTTMMACKHDLSDCRMKAKDMLMMMLSDCKMSKMGTRMCSKVMPDMRRTVYCYGTAMLDNDMDSFMRIMDLYKMQMMGVMMGDAMGKKELEKIRMGMTCAMNMDQLMKVVMMTRSKDMMMNDMMMDEAMMVLRDLGMNDMAGMVLMKDYEMNMMEVMKMSMEYKMAYFHAMTNYWSMQSQVDMLMKWMNMATMEEDKKMFMMLMDKVKMQMMFNHEHKDIVEWLVQHFAHREEKFALPA